MTLKIKRIFTYLILAIILVVIIFTSVIFYNQYQRGLRYKKVFPDQPVIKNIAHPKIAAKLPYSGIKFPTLLNGNLYYLSAKGVFTDIYLDGLQTKIIPYLNLKPDKILFVKWFDEQNVLIGMINEEYYEAIDEAEETLDQAIFHDQQYMVLNTSTGQKKDIRADTDLQNALWSNNNKEILILEQNHDDDYILFSINIGNSLKTIAHNFGQDQPIFTDQEKLINDCLYYNKSESNSKLYQFCLNTAEEKILIDNVINANISPNGRFALVNLSEKQNFHSVIYDIVRNKIIFSSQLPILISRAVWDSKSENLYYLMGENLKMGDESKLLNRRPSYVFFKYDAVNHKNEQLNNHIYENPLDAQNLMFDEIGHKLYFIDIYMAQNSLYYLDLTS